MPEVLGAYTPAELAAMSRAEFEEARERGFRKPVPTEDSPVTAEEVAAAYAQARADLPEHPTGRAAAAGTALGSSVPVALPQPGPNVWASQKAAGDLFTCPSGQTCRIRRLSPEVLLMAGVLDEMSALEDLAAKLADKAEGEPPAKPSMPSREDLEGLLTLINKVVPLAVSEPKVWADDADAPEGAVTVSDIDLDDRMAIMEHALRGVKSLERFRHAG